MHILLEVQWYAAKYANVIMIILLYFSGNIPGNDLSKGEVLCDYMKPFPPKGTGYHRFIFTLYKQEQHIDFSSEKRAPQWLVCLLTLSVVVLGRSSIIIDNQTFTSLIMINRLGNWQSIIIGKGDT